MPLRSKSAAVTANSCTSTRSGRSSPERVGNVGFRVSVAQPIKIIAKEKPGNQRSVDPAEVMHTCSLRYGLRCRDKYIFIGSLFCERIYRFNHN